MCAGQKILFMNEMKWYEIWQKLKGWAQKIFWTLLPNFIQGLNENCHIFIHFAWTKVSRMKQAKVWYFAQKAPFPNNHSNWGNKLWNFADISAEFSKIFWSFTALCGIKQNFTVLNAIKWKFCPISFNFVILFAQFLKFFGKILDSFVLWNFVLIIWQLWRKVKK